VSYASELLASRELIANLTIREIKGKYRRTVLGQLWSLANPLATMLVYTIVFAFIFQAQPRPGDPSGLDIYPLWLLAGYLPWTFFVRAVTGSIGSVIGSAGLLKKVYFPRAALPISTTASVVVTWGIEMLVLVVAVSIAGAFVLPWLPLVIVFMLLLALFGVGVGMLLAIANVYFRDVQHLTTIALTLWMYLTPIIYPIHLVEGLAERHGEWILTLYRLNPMERFVTVFRNLIYDTRWPAADDVLWCVGWSAIALTVGFLVFRAKDRRLAELL
jgi:ABC-type polysaccharide/polyol phosphate export permease